MRMTFIMRLHTIAVMLILSIHVTTVAQMPVCPTDSGLVYILSVNGSDSKIHNWNPYMPLSATNPWLNTIAPLPNLWGLAVSENLNSATAPSPTFYAVDNGGLFSPPQFHYYDGTTWINTGHTAGGYGAVNIGAGGGYIYSLNAATGEVYRYDGTSNAILVTTVTDFNGNGPYDIVADCEGNFYLVKCDPSGWLRKYSASGTLIYQWALSGAPSVLVGYGLAINGSLLIFYTDQLYMGTIDPAATSISVSPVSGTFPTAYDFGSCPIGGSYQPANDTIFNCFTNETRTIKATGIAPYSYTIVSGIASVTGTGPVFQVSTADMSTIVLHSQRNPLFCGTGPIDDTFRIVPAPVVDAGLSDTFHTCGNFETDTLLGLLSNTQAWINYTLSWTPTANIVSGGNALNPIIQPPFGSTMFYLTVTTDSSHGGCSLSDSVLVYGKNETVKAGYKYLIMPSCSEDTVNFINTSSTGVSSFWDFGDGHTDTTSNPEHIFTPQNAYLVKLIVNNAYCMDSTIGSVDTRHPLTTAFHMDHDTLCQDSLVRFSNLSTVSLQPAIFSWDFGDGSTSSVFNPSHEYQSAGVYRVMLVATDSIGCHDTAYQVVTVDSTPYLEGAINKHRLCMGDEVLFNALYTRSGNIGLAWDFGDQSGIDNLSNTTHAYDRSGQYYIRLTADYRVCPSITWMDSVTVFPMPTVYLGPDTSICFQGTSITLSNDQTAEVGDHYLWNTGDTTKMLKIIHEGQYSLKVANSHGCVSTDEVVVHKDCYIDIPNAFTPDDDGINDYFFPRQLLSKGVTEFSMQVFNRWGQVIFRTTEIDGRGWDGRFNAVTQPAGVYLYLIDVNINGRKEHYEGNLTLLR